MKYSIVTGGAGFIGSHLVDLLLDNGHKVIVIDNYSTGRPQNLDNRKGSSNLQLFNVDINDYLLIADFFRDADIVFHLAALADIVPSIEKPLEYHNSNVNGTFNVLRASYKGGVKRFIYAASSSCYGIPDSYPTNESAEIRPQYPYALTKYIGECYVMHWAQVYKIPAVSLRLFNVYGPRSRTSGTYGAVFGVFLKQKLEGKPFTVVGDGTQTRDFTYVTDVVNAFYAAAMSNISGVILNVGSGGTYSVNRLVDLLGGEKVFIPKRPGEPDTTFADVAKIKKLLNWEANISFEDGVRKVLDNIDYWRDAPLWEPDSIANATKAWFKYLS
jgi:UDP-glucose 4-epimerase